MFERLAKLFRRSGDKLSELKWPDSREIDYTRQGWGHALHIGKNWTTEKPFNITGHYFGRGLIFDKGIKEGDVLLIRMTNGSTGKLRVHKIGWFRDPNDMFSAKVRFDGLK